MTKAGNAKLRQKHQSVPCPVCQAEVGQPCRYMNDGVPGKAQRGIHGTRELVAFQAGDQ